MNVYLIFVLYLGLKSVIFCLIMIIVVSVRWDFLGKIVILILTNVCYIFVKMELNVRMGLGNIYVFVRWDI